MIGVYFYSGETVNQIHKNTFSGTIKLNVNPEKAYEELGIVLQNEFKVHRENIRMFAFNKLADKG